MAVDIVARGMAAEALSGGGGGGGSSTLAGLTDVDLSSPTNGQTLVYNATSGKWENGAGGGALVVHATESGDTLTLDKTWQEIHDADALFIVWEEDNTNKYYLTCVSVIFSPPIGSSSARYSVNTVSGGDVFVFNTNSASGYPSYTFE